VLEQEPLVGAIDARLLTLRFGAIESSRIAPGVREQTFRECGVLLGRDVFVARAIEHRQQRIEVAVGLAERQIAVELELEQALAQEHE